MQWMDSILFFHSIKALLDFIIGPAMQNHSPYGLILDLLLDNFYRFIALFYRYINRDIFHKKPFINF